ncbi:MAG TPA: hypothetical protein VJB82_02635 [Candidatus Peribacterales bacterium]|nr:hypothetical protein [Candidatus Peribacterales bacterium]
MDQGLGMNFHPSDGTSLAALSFSSELNVFFSLRVWSTDPKPHISDGRVHKQGNAYPRHWMYDPFTGSDLVTHNDDYCGCCGGEW